MGVGIERVMKVIGRVCGGVMGGATEVESCYDTVV